MARIPDSIINKLNALDILEVAKKLMPSNEFKKKGSYYFSFSPFSQEKTPSFSLSPAKGYFKDYSSGKAGSVITLVMEVEQLNFIESCNWLAEFGGIEIPKTVSEEEEEAFKKQAAQKIVTAQAVQYYIQSRSSNFEDFVHKREIKPEIADLFELGEAPISDVSQFKGRIIFPIWDKYGKPIGFGGRSVKGQEPKYINSSNDDIYQKSKVLYALHLARKYIAAKGVAVLVEGYMDVIACHQAGIQNVIATCGTTLSSSQSQTIGQLTNDIILLRDADNAGVKSAAREIDILLKEGLDPHVVSLPDGLDPDEFIKKNGGEKLEFYLKKQRKSWIQFLYDYEHRNRSTLNEDTGDFELAAKDRAAISKSLLGKLRLIEDELSRLEYAKDVADLLSLDFGYVLKNCGLKSHLKTSNLPVQAERNTFRRSWEDYNHLLSVLNLKPSPDFCKNENGFIEISYKKLNGDPKKVRKNRKSIEAIRHTDQYYKPNAVYIPPAMREDYGDDKKPGPLHPKSSITNPASAKDFEAYGNELPLYIVQDEVTAHLLSEFGIPAVGISRAGGFRRNAGQKEFAPELKEVITKFDFRHVVLAVSGEAFALPDELENQPDLAENALKHRDILIAFNQCLGELNKKVLNYVAIAKSPIEKDDDLWLDELLIHLLHTGSDISATLHQFMFSDEEESQINIRDISYIREEQLEQILFVDNAQPFYDQYREFIKDEFRFRGKVFEVDERTGAVKLKLDEGDELSVKEKNGRYYSLQRGGSYKRISNFSLICQLEVKAEESYNIYQITSLNGRKATTIIPDADFTDRTRFFKAIRRLPLIKGSWLGSSQDCLELQTLVNQDAPEAEPLNRELGVYHLDVAMKQNDDKPFIVYGNGIVDHEGKFLPIDDRGLVRHQGRIFFLPAFSTIKTTDNASQKYKRERLFIYKESAITFEKWLDAFLKVHGENGHITFFYYLACLNRDMIVDHFGRFPHLFLRGPKNAGKGTLQESIGALFHEVLVMNLNDAPTTSSYRNFFSQYRNAFTVINEINPSSVPDWMITGLKGPYDNQTRLRMAGPRTNEIDYGVVSSGVICMGQEEEIYRQEAVATRSIFVECNKEVYTNEETELYGYLKNIEVEEGLGHITAEFFALREQIKNSFKDTISFLQTRLKDLVVNSNKIDSRLFYNWAVAMAPAYILIQEGHISYPISLKEILKYAAKRIEEHASKLISRGVLEIFFGWIEAYYMQRTYEINDTHVWLDHAQGKLNISLKRLYPQFLRYLKATTSGIENVSLSDLKRRIKRHPAFVPGAKGGTHSKVWLGYKRDANQNLLRKKITRQISPNETITVPGEGIKFESSAYVFNYKHLNIEINVPMMPWEIPSDEGATATATNNS